MIFDRQVKRMRAVLDNHRLFFVCGAPKSGTTWLQKALDAHSQVVCAGEGHFGDKFAPGMGKMLKEYFQHQNVVDKNVYEGKPHYRRAPREAHQFLTAAFILGAFSNLTIPAGTRLIGDKTPANVDHLELLHSLFPEALFVNIVRDGRDTLTSTFKHAERVVQSDAIADIDAFLLEKTPFYCTRWVEALEKADRFSKAHPGALHTVRYEDLKGDFPEAFARVLDFLGADSSELEVAKCETASSFKQLSGGRDAGEENATAFFRKGIVGDWRSNLSPKHLDIFNRIGAEWLSRLGYEPLP